MRVLVVAPDYHGYDRAIVTALRRLGCDAGLLSYYPQGSVARKVYNRTVDVLLPAAGVNQPGELRRRRFNDRVLSAFRNGRCGAVLVVKGEVLDPSLLETLGRTARLVHWAFDDPYRWPRVSAALPLYDSIAAFSRKDTARLVADGYPAFHLPDGYDSFVFGVTPALGPVEWRKQVSFLGARYPKRERVLASVGAEFDLGIWGGDWKRMPWRARYYGRRGPLDTMCMGKAGPREADLVYRSCLVNLNIHGEWDGLNMRVFEIPGAGGFQLCDERDELSDYLEPGREVATYSSQDDLLAKLADYTEQPAERARIADAGRTRVEAEHTLLHRAARLLETIRSGSAG